MIRALVVVAIMLVGGAIMLAIMPDIVNRNEDVRTDAAEDTGLTCSTGAGETSCSITLDVEHEYSDTSQMTVSETSPSTVDRTATTTVGSDRKTLTITGLTANTSYIFDVDYRQQAANVSDGLNDFMRVLPPIVVIGFFALVVIAGAFVIGGNSRRLRI